MAAVTICSDFTAQENKVSHCFHCFSICHEKMRLDAIISVFWMLSFKPAFSFSSFTLIKRFFSSSSHSAFRRVSSAYLRVLLFLLAILIPACESSSLAFYMMYSAYKLNKGDNIQLWCTPFPIWNQPIVLRLIVYLSSYRFLRRQVRWSGISISKNFPQFVVIHTIKGFSIVNEAEVYVFLESPSLFYDPVDVGNLISGSSAFSKPK